MGEDIIRPLLENQLTKLKNPPTVGDLYIMQCSYDDYVANCEEEASWPIYLVAVLVAAVLLTIKFIGA